MLCPSVLLCDKAGCTEGEGSIGSVPGQHSTLELRGECRVLSSSQTVMKDCHKTNGALKPETSESRPKVISKGSEDANVIQLQSPRSGCKPVHPCCRRRGLLFLISLQKREETHPH